MDIRHKIISQFKLMSVFFISAIFLAFFMVAPALAYDASSYSGPDAAAAATAAGQSPTGLGNAFNSGPGSPLNAVAVQGAGFNTSANFETIISTVITMVLSLMGVIFLILAVYSGFKWMTAGGNEEAVEKAKKTLINAVIGLVAVLASYVISRFIVEIFGTMVFKQN